MLITCPSCKARFGLDVALEEDAARELLPLLAELEPSLAVALVSYLGLFRSATRALSWSRTLRLAQEVLALDARSWVLEQALHDTVASLRDKQQMAGWKPLSNHNYLKRVVESVAARGDVAPVPRPTAPTHTSKMGQALDGLGRKYAGG